MPVIRQMTLEDAVHSDGGAVRLLAAFDEASATEVLRAVFATTQEEVSVSWITSAQQWAVTACVQAGLELRMDAGAVFLGGDTGPFTPYLPSGAFL